MVIVPETNWGVRKSGNHLEGSASIWVSLGGRKEFRDKVACES